MNKVSVALALLALLGFAAMCAENRDLSGNQKATLKLLTEQKARTAIWQAKYAEAASRVRRDVDTVRVRVDRVRQVRDTLRITDTVQVKEYVARTDSALQACTELANSCELFKRTADSTVHSLRVERDYLAKEYERIRRARAWQSKLWPVALIGGAILGSYIRGQP